METSTIHKTHNKLGLGLVISLLVLALSIGAEGKIEPSGKNIGAVQFDAVIELNLLSSNQNRTTLIFARYWVGPDYYSTAVAWAEPQSVDLYFTTYPPTLSVTSDEQNFNIGYEFNPKYNGAYKRPLGERGVFRYMFGDYPFSNIRFAEQEALDSRVYTYDLKNLNDANNANAENSEISVPVSKDRDTRNISTLKVSAIAGRIDSMQLFDPNQQLLKDISYEYQIKAGKTHLLRQTVVLPERPLMVGFKGKGIKVTLDGKQYQYRDLEAMHHADSRKCEVEYETVKLGSKELSLPAKITVRSGKDERIMRSVRLFNFKNVEIDAAGAEKAAKQFSGFTAEQRQYREFLSKYWKESPTNVDERDIESIRQLYGHFEKALTESGDSAGEKLKLLNILMELNLILGDEKELKQQYECYLSTLTENKLFDMMLVGGYGVIEKTMFWHNHNAAGKLLGPWVDAVLEFNDDESILLFARSQLAKKRLWTTIKLLESFSAKYLSRTDVRFEAEVLRCIALSVLCKLLSTNDIAEKGLMARVQADWVSSIGKDGLKKMLEDDLNQAKRLFAGLDQPTRQQKVLRAQLEKIQSLIIH